MTYKLQNLLNECIMLEESGYRLGKFSIDLLEAQKELDEIKQLHKHFVSQQRKLLVAYDNFKLMTPQKFSCSEECIDAFLATHSG